MRAMKVRLVDAHTHLTDDEFSSMTPYILNMLRMLGIRAISVSMDMKTSDRNLALAEDNSDVIIPFIGIHPWSNEDLDQFIEYISKNKDRIAGIGEIGLDRKYTRDEEGYATQKHVFEGMLAIAEKFGKPISVHSRGSVDDVLSMISTYNIKGVLLHWFAGSKRELRKANERGYYVSYGPVLLYSPDKKSLLKDTDRDLILVETDGPVRYSRCFENKMALPSFLPSVVFALARTLRMDYDEASTMLLRNSERYLKG